MSSEFALVLPGCFAVVAENQRNKQKHKQSATGASQSPFVHPMTKVFRNQPKTKYADQQTSMLTRHFKSGDGPTRGGHVHAVTNYPSN